MSHPWTGYGVVLFPKDTEQPRCKLFSMGPDACPTLDQAAGLAQALYKSGLYHGIVVDRWDSGKIVQGKVFALPVDFNDQEDHRVQAS